MAELPPPLMQDSDLSRKVRKTCDKVTENLYVATNEPMLACFRIQEHVQKTVPILVDKSTEMRKNEPVLKGLLYDIEYSRPSVELLGNCTDRFSAIQQRLKECVFYKQQIDYNESIKRRVLEKQLLQKQESQEFPITSASSPPAAATAGGPPSSSSPSSTPSKRTTKARISAKGSSSAFNRFSASFDFSSASFPINVASSVSADLKDLKTLITQFAANNLQHHQQQKPPASKVVASTSLQVLSESPVPPQTAETTSSPPAPPAQTPPPPATVAATLPLQPPPEEEETEKADEEKR